MMEWSLVSLRPMQLLLAGRVPLKRRERGRDPSTSTTEGGIIWHGTQRRIKSMWCGVWLKVVGGERVETTKCGEIEWEKLVRR